MGEQLGKDLREVINGWTISYGSFGVAHENTSDGMDAVSPAQRKAGSHTFGFMYLHVSEYGTKSAPV